MISSSANTSMLQQNANSQSLDAAARANLRELRRRAGSAAGRVADRRGQGDVAAYTASRVRKSQAQVWLVQLPKLGRGKSGTQFYPAETAAKHQRDEFRGGLEHERTHWGLFGTTTTSIRLSPPAPIPNLKRNLMAASRQ